MISCKFVLLFCFFKQKTAYEMRISDWSSDVCSSDLLAPGMGKTKTGRLWVYVRDERPHGGSTPPAAAYFYSPDRKGEHPQRHLAGFSGHLVADAYAGFNALYVAERQPGPVIPVACWAPVRRKFHDVHALKQSPVPQERLERRMGRASGKERVW